MQIRRFILPLVLLLPAAASAQTYSETWFAITPTLPQVGADVAMLATVWAPDQTPTGSVEFRDRSDLLSTQTLVPLAVNHGQIDAGQSGHTCVIGIDGGVWCWGLNNDGQLGDGTTDTSDEPQPVVGLPEPVTQIAVGGRHTCALTVSGDLWCWGANFYGQLGVGDRAPHAAPVQVPPQGEPFVQIDAAAWSTCAVLLTGEVYCWGRNTYGEVGDGTTEIQDAPAKMPSLPGRATSVATGYEHTCAILRNTRVFCWGRNQYGELGDGTTTDRLDAVGVVSGRNALMVVPGLDHTCLLRTNGTVRCWGRNNHGQLGDGTTVDRLRPVRAIAAGRDVTDIASGYEHTCVVNDQGRVRCWGHNLAYQLGDGTNTDRPDGVVPNLPGNYWWAVSAHYLGTCAQGNNGQTYCWGYNDNGATGSGSTDTFQIDPMPVQGGNLAWPRAGAFAWYRVPGGWPAGLRRLRAIYLGNASLLSSRSNRIDHTTLP